MITYRLIEPIVVNSVVSSQHKQKKFFYFNLKPQIELDIGAKQANSCYQENVMEIVVKYMSSKPNTRSHCTQHHILNRGHLIAHLYKGRW